MAVAEVVAFLKANTDDFTAKIDEAEKKIDKLSKSGASNFSKLATIGKFALFGVASAAGVVGIASIDMADKYQEATNSIAANGAISIDQANKIGKAFLATAGTTVYSAQDIASSFSAVAGQVKIMNGGALNAKAAMDVMRPAMDLAEASGESLSATTSDIASTLQAFGLKIKQSPLVSNVLFNAARDTGQSVDTLSSQLDKVKAKMGDAAPPINEMGGLLVDLTEHGETGRAAMSALSTGITGLQTPTAAVSKAQQELGVSFTTASGQLVPLSQIIGELQPKIAGMGDAQATALLKSVGFGSAAAKLLTTIQAGPAVFDQATAAVARQNSAHEAAEKQAQTLNHQVELVKATIQDYGVKLGQVLLPKLEDLLKVGLKVVAWFEKHKAVAVALAGVIAGVLTTAIVAYGITLAKTFGESVTSSIKGLTVAFNMLTGAETEADAAADANPLGLIVLAAMAFAAVAYEVYTHWKDIASFFVKVWHDVDKVFHDAVKDIEDIIKGWWPLILGIFTGGLGLLVGLCIKYWSTIKDDIVRYWNDIVNFFESVPGKILSFLEGAGTWLLNVGKDIIHGMWQGLVGEADIVLDVGDTIWGWLKTATSDAIHWLEDVGKNIVEGLLHGIENAEGDVLGGIKKVGSDLEGAFKSVLSIFSPSKVFYAHGQNIIQGLANGITDSAHIATGAIAGVGNSLSLGSAGGIAPIAGAGAGVAGVGNQPVYLQVDGRTFATLMLPSLQTVALQAQRGSSVPIFGTVQ